MEVVLRAVTPLLDADPRPRVGGADHHVGVIGRDQGVGRRGVVTRHQQDRVPGGQRRQVQDEDVDRVDRREEYQPPPGAEPTGGGVDACRQLAVGQSALSRDNGRAVTVPFKVAGEEHSRA